MKRRTAFLGTSAGTITTPKPKGALARMMEAQERDRARDRAFTMHLGGESPDIQAGGADKPRE